MKIIAVCGHGLGSSFMMEMNIKKALKTIGVEASVDHTDLASVVEDDADLFVMGRDIAASCNIPKEKIIVMTNIISVKEYEEKLHDYFNR